MERVRLVRRDVAIRKIGVKLLVAGYTVTDALKAAGRIADATPLCDGRPDGIPEI